MLVVVVMTHTLLIFTNIKVIRACANLTNKNSNMNTIVEENYAMVRALLLIKKNHPREHSCGCWYWQFLKVIFGPMLRSPKSIRTDADIKVAARAWANPATRAIAEITYGHISDWETSQVTNMEKLFCGNIYVRGDTNMQSFNDDISGWDTSNVTTMYGMFWDALAFTGDLSRWDISKVRNMNWMFGHRLVEATHNPRTPTGI